mgnify:CR=1 FL=1
MVIKVSGVNPRKVNSAVMAEELARLGLDPEGAIPIKIERLMTHIKVSICGSNTKEDFESWVAQNVNHENVAVCEPGCGGISTISDFERCPFCGDSDMNVQKTEKLTTIVPPEVISQDSLDQNVQLIHNLKSSMADNYYALGLALRDNYEKCLWALRKKASGEGKYKNFEAWARNEVKLGRTQTMKCIEVVENFTEEEVRRIGHSKLAIALQVPQTKRAELLEAAEAGASKRELEAAVAEMKGKIKESVTVALSMAETRLPLMKRPESAEAELEPAVEIDDEPWGVETLSNGIAQSYRVIRNDEGEIVLLIQRHRKE